jgi:hypothetical protein
MADRVTLQEHKEAAMSGTGISTRKRTMDAAAEEAEATATPARATRSRTEEGPDYRSMTPAVLFQFGFNRFKAAIPREWEDHSGECHVTLHYLAPGTNEPVVIVGSTGAGHGHAEVTAVTEFVMSICKGNIGTYKMYQRLGRGNALRMQCEGKPVCVRCAAFLGLLGIQRFNAHTQKIPRTMGSTEWSPIQRVRDFMRDYLEVTSDQITAFVRYSP